ncbi:MAG: redoxin family protein [bacterium]
MKYSIRFLFNLIRGIATLGWYHIYVAFHKRMKAHFDRTSVFLKNAARQEKFQSISDDVQNFQTNADYTLNNCLKRIRISEKLVIFPLFCWLAISFLLPLLNVHGKEAGNILLHFSPLLILSGAAFIYSTVIFPYFINVKILNLMRTHEKIEKKYWDICVSQEWLDSYKFLESFNTARFPVLLLSAACILLIFLLVSIFFVGKCLFTGWAAVLMLSFNWVYPIQRRYGYHLENHRNLRFIEDEVEEKEIIPALKIKKCFTIKNIIAAGLLCVIASGIFVIKDYIKEAERERRKEDDRKMMALKKKRDYDKAKARYKREVEKRRETIGKKFDLEFTDIISKKNISFSSNKNKIIIIDFWATWCGPCVAEIPRMKKLYSKYKNKNVLFIGINLDKDKDKVISFCKENQIEWPQYYDGKSWNSDLVRKWGIRGIPTLFALNKGNIIYSVEARRNTEQIIEELIKK